MSVRRFEYNYFQELTIGDDFFPFRFFSDSVVVNGKVKSKHIDFPTKEIIYT